MKKNLSLLTMVMLVLLTSCGQKIPNQELKELPGRFAINENTYVRFSPGNLQYQASTNSWRFADVQYGIIGEQNNNISSSNEGWIDLFGWGTSGNEGLQPYTTSTIYSDYIGTSDDITNSFYDWGNSYVQQHENEQNEWFTLTAEEWAYLIKHHTTGIGKVENLLGLIILPEDWDIPYDCEFTKGTTASKNVYDAAQWEHMEANGAVFLPAAGYRHATQTMNVGSYGYYWSTTAEGSHCAYHLYLGNGEINANNANSRINGYSVRLVKKF
ncbi:MAG: hypothetical protein Q4D14_01965 [Bacteroidales bacterium]|nr:hypothetical protein [Bacteroidales bacterium]